MPHSDLRDVRNALAPEGREVGTAATLADDQLLDAILQADAMIDSYTSKYAIPQVEEFIAEEGRTIKVAPAPVRYWSRDIASYLATLTFKRNQDVTVDDPIRLRFNIAMSDLVAVRDGRSTLPFSLKVALTGAALPVVVNQYEGSLFRPADFDLAYQSEWAERQRW